jgi:mRNA interferase YafQ
MYAVVASKRFRRSFRKIERSGKLTRAVRSDISDVFELLAKREQLPTAYADHQLQGEYAAYRECHIKSDLLLMYRIDIGNEIVELSDIGSHSQLFG